MTVAHGEEFYSISMEDSVYPNCMYSMLRDGSVEWFYALNECREILDQRQASIEFEKLAEYFLTGIKLKIKNLVDDLVTDENEDYDEKFLAPETKTVSTIKKLLNKIYCELDEEELPLPALVPDGKGGVEANWKLNGRYLQLIVPNSNSGEPYVFRKNGKEFQIKNFANHHELLENIYWLLEK